jgi:hypothetical protein
MKAEFTTLLLRAIKYNTGSKNYHMVVNVAQSPHQQQKLSAYSERSNLVC